MILNMNRVEVDNILFKETAESGIDLVYKCGNNVLISRILHLSNKLSESLIPNEKQELLITEE